MASYLQNVTNFSHCPLKKRPLHIIAEDSLASCDQPQDLRIKRRKEESPDLDIAENSSSLPLRLSPSPIRIPTPAYTIPAVERPTPQLADFYLHLFQQSAYKRQQQRSEGMWSLLQEGPMSILPSVSPTESNLSSPRSTSSEDSGVGSEELASDYEIDVVNVAEIPNRHTCDSCGKSYSTISGLKRHKEVHCSVPRTFSCQHCSKSYTSVGALKMHIRTHTLPCKCDVCGKAFSRPWLLQGHIRTHTGEKPFKCNQCHRSFADRSNLRAHQQTHERVKKYACKNCSKTFSRTSLLNKHSGNSCPGLSKTQNL